MTYRRGRTRNLTVGSPTGAVFVALVLMSMLFLVGCANDLQPTPPPAQAVESSEEPADQSVPSVYAPPLGSVGLNERVFDAAVIARVKLKGTEAAAEHLYTNEDGNSVYRGFVRFAFEVLEYLKGAGDGELVVDATVEIKSEVIRDIMDRRARGESINWYGYDYENPYRTRERAITAAKLWARNRDTRWDDREAIIFAKEVESSDGTKRYTFGPLYDLGIDGLNRAWLPSARAGGANSAVADDSPTGGRFLLEDPDRVSPRGTSGLSSAPATTSVSELKELKKELDDWRKAGEGVVGYLECIRESFSMERLVNGEKERGEFPYAAYDFFVDSGLPEGTVVNEPLPLDGKSWFEGKDNTLFALANGTLHTTRPLPTGEYTIYYNYQKPWEIPCDYYHDELRDTGAWIYNVEAPEGVLHEAFFDPEEGDSGGSGADDSRGVITPASFSNDSGNTIVIERVEWKNGKATVEFSSSALRSGHHVDFIALDGSVALRLRIVDASQSTDGDNTTLTWVVCTQPWAEGEKLMLRVSESGPDLSGVTDDSACLTPNS